MVRELLRVKTRLANSCPVIQTTRPFLFQSTDGNPEERAWLDLVFSDSAVLEASLCVAETQRCLVQRGAVDYANVGRYKRNAIKMIGERLNDPALRISEGTLNAVLALAYSEVCHLCFDGH